MTASLEALVLGAVLDADGPAVNSSAGALLDAAGLRPDDFVDRRVATCWTVALKLAERRLPCDAATIAAAGLGVRLLDDGVLLWLRGLQAANALDVPRFSEVAEQLRRRGRARKVLESLRAQVAQLEGERPDLPAVLAALEGVVEDAGALHSPDGDGSEDLADIAAQWQLVDDGKAPSLVVPTGLPGLDAEIGGLPPNLSLLIGQPAVGKSALLGSMIDAQLEAGLRVGLFGLEDGSGWLARRLVARELAVPVRDVANLRRDPAQASAFGDAYGPLAARLKGLVTYRHDTISTDELCRRAVHWVTNLGVRCIYVDHAGEVDHRTDRFDEHRLRVGESYRRLRNLAFRYQVPVVVVAHTGRPNDFEERPPLPSEIAETSYAERRARLILGCWRKKSEPGHMRVSVIKHNEGKPDSTVSLPRLVTCALVSRHGAELIDLDAERREAAKAKAVTRATVGAELAAVREAVRAKAKAAKAESKAQPELALGGAA